MERTVTSRQFRLDRAFHRLEKEGQAPQGVPLMNTLRAQSRALLGAGLLLLGVSAAAEESLHGALEASVNRLDLTLVGTVILEVGNEAGYRVTADEAEALAALRIETRGRRLIVQQETPKRSGWIWDKDERLPVTLIVTLPAFETVAFAGAGRLTGEGLSGDELSLRLAGPGSVSLGIYPLGTSGLPWLGRRAATSAVGPMPWRSASRAPAASRALILKRRRRRSR